MPSSPLLDSSCYTRATTSSISHPFCKDSSVFPTGKYTHGLVTSRSCPGSKKAFNSINAGIQRACAYCTKLLHMLNVRCGEAVIYNQRRKLRLENSFHTIHHRHAITTADTSAPNCHGSRTSSSSHQPIQVKSDAFLTKNNTSKYLPHNKEVSFLAVSY